MDASVITLDPNFAKDSERSILASSITEGMTIRVPNRGPISIAHVASDHDEILVTNSVYDTDVDAPIARFPRTQEVSRIFSTL